LRHDRPVDLHDFLQCGAFAEKDAGFCQRLGMWMVMRVLEVAVILYKFFDSVESGGVLAHPTYIRYAS
jgi:hypothetical protein